MNVVVAGGGPAGLISAILLARKGIAVTLLEKKSYPAHKVCGEYISGETLPFLLREGLLPDTVEIPTITRFQLSSISGKSRTVRLPLGGFGISRYCFDHFLYEKALASGVTVFQNEEVLQCSFLDNSFFVKSSHRELRADYAIGAFGKRSRLDKSAVRSAYIGVKYHIRSAHPADLIALHNFDGGYCGVSRVEGGLNNLCYLSTRDNLRRCQTIPELEKSVLFRNPLIRELFVNSEFLWSKPETINEISFHTKSPVVDHMFMTGDAAGMIAPLAGNGIAMAIRSAKLLSDILIEGSRQASPDRNRMEEVYRRTWNENFYRRLGRGRILQNLFGGFTGSEFALRLMGLPVIRSRLIRATHGKPF